jgi:hypothetical protein
LANTTVGTFVVNPDTNIVVNRVNITRVELWRFVLFARVVSISGLGGLIPIYVLWFIVFILVCLISYT